MANETDVRVSLVLPEDIAVQADAIKQKHFYNRSASDMYRELIRLGIKALEKKEGKK